eukprot:TRINITY_DN5575_c0_g1_i1.p1 TRINITY_DN5575_c0_g1~~TRINITY_DN5575_c0_g1_i1.p1  ORF type:complete len:320 (-),score=91.06 TRINITY_DN5575_c0_g1_i1:411-1370(-)
MDDDDFIYEDDNPSGSDGGSNKSDPNEDKKVEVENAYFHARDSIKEEPEVAIESFEKVLTLEKELEDTDYEGDWGFKALKRLCKLYCQQAEPEKMVQKYKQLLNYERKPSDAAFSKGVNKVLDSVAGGSPEHVLQIYKLSLDVLKGPKNEAVWLKVNLKLAKLFLDQKDYTRLAQTLEDLKKSCQLPTGEEDLKKATTLLDVYSTELQMWMDRNDSKKTKEVHHKAQRIINNNPGILNSKLALVHYCGGRLLMEQRDWEGANRSLYEAYHFWEESGDPLRIPCLKYILIANMLMGSKINPFDSPKHKKSSNPSRNQNRG